MEQSAVEWQFEQFFNSFEKFNNGEYTFNEYLKRNLEIREQAKAMQDEQMQLTWNNAIDAVQKDKWHSYYEFYNNNFKSE